MVLLSLFSSGSPSVVVWRYDYCKRSVFQMVDDYRSALIPQQKRPMRLFSASAPSYLHNSRHGCCSTTLKIRAEVMAVIAYLPWELIPLLVRNKHRFRLRFYVQSIFIAGAEHVILCCFFVVQGLLCLNYFVKYDHGCA